MSRKMMTKTVHFCSFCGKSQEDVETIIAGPDDVDICDECVDICNDIIKENKSKVSKG